MVTWPWQRERRPVRTLRVRSRGDFGDVRRVEEELSDLLMAQVEVRVKKSGRRSDAQAGELAIAFASLDELNGLIERLRGP